MKNPFFIIILLILCISQVQAATVLNSLYKSDMAPGQTGTHVMTMKADTPQEIGKPLIITTAGDCSGWITVDKASMNLNAAGTPVKAVITVPTDATNGYHQCAVQYTSEPSGMITSRIEVPFKITITGGINPTITATEAPTMKAPVQDAEPVHGSQAPGQIPYVIVGVGIILAAFGIIVYRWHHER